MYGFICYAIIYYLLIRPRLYASELQLVYVLFVILNIINKEITINNCN